jgi:hypothetical protein
MAICFVQMYLDSWEKHQQQLLADTAIQPAPLATQIEQLAEGHAV